MSDDVDLDKQLEYTEQIRKGIVEQILNNHSKEHPGEMPTDKDTVLMVQKILKDMDSASIGRQRLKIESQEADTNKNLAEAALFSAKNTGNQNRFLLEEGEKLPEGASDGSFDEALIGEYKLVDGETDVGWQQNTLEDVGLGDDEE